MPDVMTMTFDKLRAAQPVEEGLLMEWLHSIAQVIASHPTALRRMAAAILVADDICKRTGVPLDVCVQSVFREVDRAKGVAR